MPAVPVFSCSKKGMGKATAGRKKRTMEYSENQLKMMVQLGALNAPADKCADILDISDREAFFADFNTAGSVVFQNYKKGQNQGDFAIDSKLFNEAKGGDVMAAVELRTRRTEQRNENLKKDLFGI